MAQTKTFQDSFNETLQRVKVLTYDKNVVALKKGRFTPSGKSKVATVFMFLFGASL